MPVLKQTAIIDKRAMKATFLLANVMSQSK